MLTQDDYNLYTNTATDFSDEDWEKLVSMSAVRLAGLLCLEELPTDEDGSLPDNLAMVLANFIFLILKRRGSDSEIVSKSIRNYKVTFGTGRVSRAFSSLGQDYGDIIDDYSKCGSTLDVEQSTRLCCGRF